MTSGLPARVCAVIVSYRPDLAVLGRLIDTLLAQRAEVVVVDNGSSAEAVQWLAGQGGREGVTSLALGDNLGIATAQNRGIDHARARGAEYVILFDQDSEPAPDMLAQLLAAAERCRAKARPLAAVGPRYLDERQDNPPPFIQVKGLRVERQACPFPDAVVEVDYLIASGCLIPLATLDAVGGMEEGMFIDYVDIEWGLRAKAAGYQCYGVCAAQMRHDLGEAPIEFLGRKLPLHSPLRHYYHFRNAVWMYRQPWLPLHWKLADGWRLLLKYGFYTLFAQPRHRHWWMMSKGVWHALRGRRGRLD